MYPGKFEALRFEKPPKHKVLTLVCANIGPFVYKHQVRFVRTDKFGKRLRKDASVRFLTEIMSVISSGIVLGSW